MTDEARIFRWKLASFSGAYEFRDELCTEGDSLGFFLNFWNFFISRKINLSWFSSDFYIFGSKVGNWEECRVDINDDELISYWILFRAMYSIFTSDSMRKHVKICFEIRYLTFVDKDNTSSEIWEDCKLCARSLIKFRCIFCFENFVMSLVTSFTFLDGSVIFLGIIVCAYN